MASTHPPRVEVVELKHLPKAGSLRALADVKVGPLIVHKCRFIRQDGQKAFLAPPQETWEDGGGKRHYAPLVTFPDFWRDALTEAVADAVNDFPEGIKRVEAATPIGREVQQRANVGGRA